MFHFICLISLYVMVWAAISKITRYFMVSLVDFLLSCFEALYCFHFLINFILFVLFDFTMSNDKGSYFEYNKRLYGNHCWFITLFWSIVSLESILFYIVHKKTKNMIFKREKTDLWKYRVCLWDWSFWSEAPRVLSDGNSLYFNWCDDNMKPIIYLNFSKLKIIIGVK